MRLEFNKIAIMKFFAYLNLNDLMVSKIFLISSGVNDEFASNNIAAAPATIGVAMLITGVVFWLR